jgi:hypothetical protein
MASTPGNRLRADLQRRDIIPLTGVYDVFSASTAARHFDGIFISDVSFAASYYGLPDAGYIAWPDIVAFVQRVRTILPVHHVVVDNAWPVIVPGGRRQGVVEGQDNFQELDAAQLHKPITKWIACVAEVSDIPSNINKAFEVAVAGRSGLSGYYGKRLVRAAHLQQRLCAAHKDDTKRAAELLLSVENHECQ